MSDAPVIFNYLSEMNDREASDMYLTVGYPPSMRVKDEMVPIRDMALSGEEVAEVLNSILTGRQKREFEHSMELNTSLDMGEMGRFRVNVLRQRQNSALVIRRIVSKIPSFDDLYLPPVLASLAMEKRGLILLTGMTGSGKSTTLASMVNHRNKSREGHIITIEDPIEYYHEHKKCVITQREVGVDTESYGTALKNALRQRPDVILVGEIRDREVMEQALTAAETGHLCLATIHTNNSYQAIERIVNFFPEDYANQIRLNLSVNLKAIISQRLLPRVDKGQVPAIEIMINIGLVRDLIMKGEIKKIREIMEQNNSQGMCTFDQSMAQLFAHGLISEETALSNSDQASDLKIKLRNIKLNRETKDMKTDALSMMDTSVISLKD